MANTIVMEARRDGECNYCGKRFEKGAMFKWHFSQRLAYCQDCPTEAKKNIEDVSVKTNVVEPQVLPELLNLFDGHFTIPFKRSGHDKKYHITLWLTTRKKQSTRRIRVLHKSTSNENSFSYIDVAEIKNNVLIYNKEFIENPTFNGLKFEAIKAAMKMMLSGDSNNSEFAMYYTLLSRRCWKCNKLLTNPETLKLGTNCGPICSKYAQASNISLDASKEIEVRIFSL